jgi:hypothetical protein
MRADALVLLLASAAALGQLAQEIALLARLERLRPALRPSSQ